MNFNESWQRFSGSVSHLSVRDNASDSGTDAALVERLAQLASRFQNAEFAERYLVLRQFGSLERARQWATSRHCLADVLESLLGRGAPPSEILVSLSHTSDRSIALGTVRAARVAGVGVDIEAVGREVSTGAEAKFTVVDEDLTFGALERWSAKEACLKAMPENQGMGLPDYRIYSADRVSGEGRARLIKAGGEFRFKLFREAGSIVAVAIYSGSGDVE